MKSVILYNKVEANSASDELDVLQQVEAVDKALIELGYEPIPLAINLNLQQAADQLMSIQPHFVFNLVESIAGNGHFISWAATLLDYLKIPYTGSNTNALFLTTDKVLTKAKLREAGLPTPDWITLQESTKQNSSMTLPAIIKPVHEDASIGLDEEAMIYETNDLLTHLKKRCSRYGDCFAEQYIHGREFNLSILASAKGGQILPPAEMCFVDYPKDKARIVDYRAKWQTDSFEYQNTVRSFDFAEHDLPLIENLGQMTRRCWELFDLSGYARVDFRVDQDQRIWILEINANPCISPDSGYVAAAERTGLSFFDVVKRIVQDCLTRFAEN